MVSLIVVLIPNRRGLCAVALVALWLGMPLVAIVHAAMEQHSYCAEHQALEHEREASADHSAAPSRDAISRAQASTAHEACSFGQDCVRDADAVLARESADLVSPPAEPLLGTSQRTRSPIAVLRTAPKSSPPARHS